MLEIKYIREDAERVIKGLQKRGLDVEQDIQKIIELDRAQRKARQEAEKKKAELNKISKQIAIYYKNKEFDKAEDFKQKAKKYKEALDTLEKSVKDITVQLQNLLIELPNVPSVYVPEGKGEAQNIIIKENADLSKYNNTLPHWDICKSFDIIDFDLGNKLTGSGFPVFKAKAVKLVRALIQFFLDQAVNAGYKEYLLPLIVNRNSGFGTCQLPDKDGQMYRIEADDLYLIPTAEVPLTNFFRDTILTEDELPIRLVAYTPCFRREAGSWGKDVRGLNRVHQFDKVEIVNIAHPDKSYDILQEMVDYVESLLQKLELPYRIKLLCGGDLGFAAACTYDFEVYASGQKKWLEVSSVSNFESFQANRMRLRIRDKKSKQTKLAHTLNGSALALPRLIAAIIENNISDKGIIIPKILKSYTGFEII